MKTPIKFLCTVLAAILLLCTVSCKKTENEAEKKTSEIQNDSPYLDESIVKILKENLSASEDSKAKPEIEETKDEVMVTYPGDEDEGIPATYSNFSKLKIDAVFGDLNGDGKNEVVVSVHTDGGTAHLQWMAIYIFTQKNNTWELLTSADSEFFFSPKFVKDGVMCGQLTPLEIKDNLLKTFMDCNFVDNDNYIVTLKLENNRLIFVKKEVDKSAK